MRVCVGTILHILYAKFNGSFNLYDNCNIFTFTLTKIGFPYRESRNNLLTSNLNSSLEDRI